MAPQTNRSEVSSPRRRARALGHALLLCAAGFPAQAQRLDPSFPTINSAAPATAAGFLDLGSADRDTSQVLVPRINPIGVSMVFTAVDGFTSDHIGLRRMTGYGAAFGANIDTLHSIPYGDTIVDGADVADRICVLTSGYDNGLLMPRAGLKCFADDGALTAFAETPAGIANRRAGAMVVNGAHLVVAGSFSTSGNAHATYRLYLERRRTSDLGQVGARVDHAIELSLPAPVTNHLTINALERDAQGRWLVAGFVTRNDAPDSNVEAFVARFNPDFSRDTGFGSNGVVNLGFSGTGANHSFGIASDVAALDNGTVAVTGVGCVSSQCGTGAGMMRSQQITRVLRSNGTGANQVESVPSTTYFEHPQLEATHAPFLPGDAVGFVLVQPQLDGAVRVQTLTTNPLGQIGFMTSDTFRLQYFGQPLPVVEQHFSNLATLDASGQTHHFVAWTSKANNGNASDFDMVMGELTPTWRVFMDSFE